MDRDIPSFNRPIMQRIYQKNHQLHLKRLKKIKNSISSNKSYQRPSYNNLSNSNSITATNYTKLPQYNDVKKQLQQEQKRTEIQRENALLFNKMIKIMKRPDKNNDPVGNNKQHPTVNAAKQRISMEFSRINQENKTFYHRLEKQKPTIDHRKLEEERLKNLNILKFLGKYPNQQAISRVSSSVASNHNFTTGQRQKRNQFNTYQLRNKKMNSTTSGDNYYNQIRYTQGQGNTLYSTNGHNFSYRNQDQGSYLQDERQKYNKFRSQITNFDNEFRELKNQQRRMNQNHNQSIGQEREGNGNYQTRSGNKFVSTMGNFHLSNQNNSFRHNMSKIPTLPKPNTTNYTTHLPFMKPQGQTSNFNYQQPSIPSRRKFLSQGANRTRNNGMYSNTAYNNNNPNMMMASYNSQQQNNHMNTNQQSLFTGQQQTVQQNGGTEHVEMPYPYYLNHPSNNIIIEDMNRKSIQSKQKAKMNKVSNHQQLPLPQKPQKQQRKLNKRNSQSNLNDFQGNLVDRTSQNNNLTTYVEKNDQNLKRFMTNSHNNGHNNKSIQSTQKRNVHNEYYEVDGQQQPVPRFAKNNTRQKSNSSNHVQEHKNFVRSSKHVEEKQMNGSVYKNDLIQQAYQNPPPKKPYFVNPNINKSQSKNSNSLSKQSKGNNNNLKNSINKSKKIINPIENESSEFQKSNISSNLQQSSGGQNPTTTIILYKTSVKLSSLLLSQQNQLIVEYMFREFHANQQFSTNQQLEDTYIKLGSILTNSLQQYSTQVTIFRQNKSYNIKTTKFTKHLINKRHPHSQQSTSHHSQLLPATQLAYQTQVTQYINRFVQQMFGNIEPMQIPQNQGSVLLQQIDYDYKYLVREMVKIEKEQEEQYQESNGVNNENKSYKLVIVLKNQDQQQQDKQPDWPRDQDDKVLESETNIKSEQIKQNNINNNNNHNNTNNNNQPPSQLNIHFNRSNQQQQQQPHQQEIHQNENNNNNQNNQNQLNRPEQPQQNQNTNNPNLNNTNTANNNSNNNNNNNINFYQADEELVD